MSSAPEISIIVPVYNTAGYIRRCVDSIIAQTFTGWELIMLDDGSTDGSLDIMREYASLDNRIRVMTHSNRGVSRTRNRGIDESRGRWITFIDSDDYVAPDYLKNLIAATRSDKNIDIVISGWRYNGRPTILKERLLLRPDYLSIFNSGVNHGFVCSKLYRSDIFKEHGVRFPEDIVFGEDGFLLMEALEFAKAVYIAKDADYHYERRQESAAQTFHPLEVELRSLRMAEKMSGKLGRLISPEIRKYINPYPYLWRCVRTFYGRGLSRHERLDWLRNLEFDSAALYLYNPYGIERLYLFLIKYRCWRLFDLLFNRIID